jgi:hypothetical protein
MNLKFLIFSFLFFCKIAFSIPFDLSDVEPIYKDSEIEMLWDSLTDIYSPNFEDYKKIENYLRNGQRPYLDSIFEFYINKGLLKRENIDRSHIWWNRLLQRMCFVGPNNEMPIFERVVLGNVSVEDKSRCIVLYASYNNDTFEYFKHKDKQGHTPYKDRLLGIISDLKREGYQGHVIFRVGGYPLTEYGGLRLAHVPYSFKVLSLIEASLLGYEEVLWLDCSIHPTNNLSRVFAQLKRNGTFLLSTGGNLYYDYKYNILPDAAVISSGLEVKDLRKIPHVIAGVIGISFKHENGHKFIKEWYRLTTLVHPAITLYPEEFLVSVASWRNRVGSIEKTGNYIDTISKKKYKPSNAKKPFWFDKS